MYFIFENYLQCTAKRLFLDTVLLALVSFPRTSEQFKFFIYPLYLLIYDKCLTVPNTREKSQYSQLFLYCIRTFFLRMVCPKDVLSLRMFCLRGYFVHWPFCPLDVFSTGRFVHSTFCIRTFCPQGLYVSGRFVYVPSFNLFLLVHMNSIPPLQTTVLFLKLRISDGIFLFL